MLSNARRPCGAEQFPCRFDTSSPQQWWHHTAGSAAVRTYTVAAAANAGYAGGQYRTAISAGLAGGSVDISAITTRRRQANIYRASGTLVYGLAGDNMADADWRVLQVNVRDYTAANYVFYSLRLYSNYGAVEQVQICLGGGVVWTDAGVGFWPSGDSPNVACFEMIIDLDRQSYLQASLNGVDVAGMPMDAYLSPPVPARNGQIMLTAYSVVRNDGLMHTFYVGDASLESLSL